MNREDHILIVDDEANVLSAINRAFMNESYIVHTAATAVLGMEVLRHHPVKVVISDERMPGVPGSEFLSHVREEHPEVIRMMLTGHASLEAAMRAINEGEIYRFFMKPWNDVELRLAVRDALDKYNLEEENRRLLTLARQQAVNLRLLERRFPGITDVERTDDGRIVIGELPADEMAAIVAQCEREVGRPDVKDA